MKLKYIFNLIALATFTIGCKTLTPLEPTEIDEADYIEKRIFTAETDEEVILFEKGYFYETIKITSPNNLIPYIGNDLFVQGQRLIGYSRTPLYKLYHAEPNEKYKVHGLAVPYDGTSTKAFLDKEEGVYFVEFMESVQFIKSTIPDKTKDYYRLVLTYLGREGNILNFRCSEYLNDLDNPTNQENLQLDFSKGSEILISKIEIEVLEATKDSYKCKILEKVE